MSLADTGTSRRPRPRLSWMAHYKVPKSVVFVDEFAKTAANKVDKQKLIEQYGS